MPQFEDQTTVLSGLKQLLNHAILRLYPESASDVELKIEYPRDDSHGDYATTVAAQLAKLVKKSPQQINQELRETLSNEERGAQPESGAAQIIRVDFDIEIAGIFLNFRLKPEFLTRFIATTKHASFFDQRKVGAGKRIIVEYSDPNIAKPLGAHHLIATVLGQSLFNLFQSLGCETIPINHIGDWGTQFGKLLVAYKKWGDNKTIEQNPIPELLKLYVQFHDEAEKDLSLEDQGRAEFLKLEQGDTENRKIWKWFVDVSLKDIKKIYNLLGGISFTEESYMGESFYEDKMQPIVEEGKKKGVFVMGEKGALIAAFPKDKYPPAIIVKADGATLYLTRDLATLKYRFEHFKPDEILYVVDVAQTLHFQQLFQIVSMLGWLKDYKGEPLHISFGRMSFPDIAMSTRKGNIILLEELIEEAKKRAYEVLSQKNPELTKEEKQKIAEKVGIGAIKYSILSQNRNTNIVFTWDKILSLEGNSAPYLQYTHARASSILKKADIQKPEPKEGNYILQEKAELNLARKLIKFKEHILFAAQEYRPNLLANYLYELSQTFNTFYHELPVLKAETEELKNARLNLVQASSLTLKHGLRLLADISAPEKM